MPVTAHVFNVGHGDSTVFRIDDDNSSSPKWVVIDSNTVARGNAVICPAFEFLKNSGVSVVDLLVVTHLHADHYTGVDQILKGCDVRKLAIPPFISRNSEVINKTIFKKIREKILDAGKSAGSSPTVNRQLFSLAALIDFIIQKEDRVQEVNGPESPIRIEVDSAVTITAFLPLPRTRGILIQKLKSGDFELDCFPEMNDSSIAVALDAHGKRLVWGADATLSQWEEHRRQMKRDGEDNLGGVLLKVPHHGSRHNTALWLFEYLCESPLAGRPVIVSANGVSHPHDEFFRLVADKGLIPYCTNLASQCSYGDVFSISDLAQVDAAMKPFLIHANAYRTPIPCQGDITVSVNSGSLTLNNSTGAPCVYEPHVVRIKRTLLP